MTDTETSILHAAQTVFLQKGLDGATMGDIAKQAHISRPCLHYYHRTKRALFQAILLDAVADIVPKIASVATSNRPLLEKAGLIIDHYHQILLKNPLLPQFFISEIQRDPKALLALLEKHSQVGELLAHLQQQHAAELLIDLPPKEALTHFFITLYGLLFFPFLTKPMLDAIFNGDQSAFHDFVSGRKTVLMDMLGSLIRPAPAPACSPASAPVTASVSTTVSAAKKHSATNRARRAKSSTPNSRC